MLGLKSNKEKISLFLIQKGAVVDTVSEKGLTTLHCAGISPLSYPIFFIFND